MEKKKNIKQQKAPNGTVYVYEDTPYWDKVKKQNRHKRDYIGKLDDEGNFIPSKKYLERQQAKEGEANSAPAKAQRTYWGASRLLDEIGEITGVRQDIETAFPSMSKEILSLAYYLVLESDSPMYRFGRWAHDHWHPHGAAISSQRISEIMRGISERGKMAFFRAQTARRQENEYLAYDTTSVSSWSDYIKAARYGKNKDGDKLPQVNMALVFGEDSALPVYYRVLPGNITDVITVRKLLKDVAFLEIKRLKLVMDRGFYSSDNINALFKGHHKFLLPIKTNAKFVSSILEEAKKDISNFRNYDEDHDVYCCSTAAKWPYIEKNRHGETIREEHRRIYVHVYYNGTRAEEEKQRFIKSLTQARAAALSGKELSESQKDLCEKYFVLTESPDKSVSIAYKDDEIKKHLEGFGYFILLSNDIKEPKIAIETYRRKDMVEKAFDNLKERLEMKRTSVHSDETLQGRFFLQFLALIYVSYIHKHMRSHGLYKNHTMQSLLDSIDIIERYEYKGRSPFISEITEKQRLLFEGFGVHLQNTS